MSDKQVFVTIVGGLLFALVSGVLLFIPLELLQHDAGDDGFGMIWILLSALSGVSMRFARTATWGCFLLLKIV